VYTAADSPADNAHRLSDSAFDGALCFWLVYSPILLFFRLFPSVQAAAARRRPVLLLRLLHFAVLYALCARRFALANALLSHRLSSAVAHLSPQMDALLADVDARLAEWRAHFDRSATAALTAVKHAIRDTLTAAVYAIFAAPAPRKGADANDGDDAAVRTALRTSALGALAALFGQEPVAAAAAADAGTAAAATAMSRSIAKSAGAEVFVTPRASRSRSVVRADSSQQLLSAAFQLQQVTPTAFAAPHAVTAPAPKSQAAWLAALDAADEERNDEQENLLSAARPGPLPRLMEQHMQPEAEGKLPKLRGIGAPASPRTALQQRVAFSSAAVARARLQRAGQPQQQRTAVATAPEVVPLSNATNFRNNLQ
jgi:hypothetical protein